MPTSSEEIASTIVKTSALGERDIEEVSLSEDSLAR